MVGVLLTVLLLASGYGPSLHQQSQACVASKDAHSAECTVYWGNGQRTQAAALRAKDVPPPAIAFIPDTNALGHMNEEFRRRTKTPASLPNEDTVVLVLFGLLHSSQVVLRWFDGWKEMLSASPLIQRQAA